MKKLRTLFVSSHVFGLVVLQEMLINHPQYDVAGIITEEQLPGLENNPRYCDFNDFEEACGIPVVTVMNKEHYFDPMIIQLWEADIAFVIGWHKLIPKNIIDLFPMGIVGMHPTLLPEGRGRSPIPNTIFKGLTKSGVTMFYLNEKADSGLIIGQSSYPVFPTDTATELFEKAIYAHTGLAHVFLPKIAKGCTGTPQDESKATYWKKQKYEHTWQMTNMEHSRMERAFTWPYSAKVGTVSDQNTLEDVLKAYKEIVNDAQATSIDYTGLIDLSPLDI